MSTTAIPLDGSDTKPGLLCRLHLDLPLFTALILLCGLGLLVLYSASGQDLAMVKRQAMRIAAGAAVMFVLAQMPPWRLKFWTPWIYSAGILLLVGVLVMGEMGKGAQRWLDLGVVRFQPSELVKLAVPMMLAWFFARRRLPLCWWQLVIALALTAIPAVLIIKQPDLGTALLVAAAGIFVIFFAGLNWKLIGAVTLSATLAVSLVLAKPDILDSVLLPYQKQRVLTLLDPEQDPLGAGYHTIQSKIAIGSGGLFGKGWLNGTQSHLEFLPERHTDFIFAVLAEELGLVGVVTLLLLYLFIVNRGLYITAQAQDTFSRLLAGGLTLVFFLYAFVNIGMVSGILPVVGVPLPLVSYGGTSLVTILAGFGILMSIHTRKRTMAH
ncbi:MAG: rod shape-determining protein RodA [Pseudomonadota bacterium]